jgi:hypothetical protein
MITLCCFSSLCRPFSESGLPIIKDPAGIRTNFIPILLIKEFWANASESIDPLISIKLKRKNGMANKDFKLIKTS